MTEEYLDILDEQGNKTGKSRPYLEAHEKGLIHAVVHVWIVNFKNEILVQKRADNKRFDPGLWDISAAGHVSAGETSLQAGIRETKEELGLDIPESNLVFLCTVEEHTVFNNGAYVNNEFDDVYVVQVDIDISDIKLLDGEVEKVKFLSIEEFKKWIHGGGEPMVPHEEYEKVLAYIMSI
jgi:isopentenyl-diphosphate delta-isomerase